MNKISLWENGFGLMDHLKKDLTFFLDEPMSAKKNSFTPACDVIEGNDHYFLSLEIPGVKKEDLQMEVIDDQLVIFGERQNDFFESQDAVTYSERRFGKFQRSFRLPSQVDMSQVEADYRDGVLRIVIPKALSAKPRKIKINNEKDDLKILSKFLNHSKNHKEEAH